MSQELSFIAMGNCRSQADVSRYPTREKSNKVPRRILCEVKKVAIGNEHLTLVQREVLDDAESTWELVFKILEDASIFKR